MLVGVSKGGLGGALGALVTPMLALVLPAPVAIGLTLPMFMIGDIFAVGIRWGTWDRKLIWAVLPGTLAGVILGSLVLGRLSATTLGHALGFAAILYSVYRIWERGRQRPETVVNIVQPWQSAAFGAGTGFASTVANVGGPVFTVYLLMLRLTPDVFVGTSALYFALLNLMKLPSYAAANILQPETLVLIAWAIPIIPFGVWSGKILDRYLDMKTFELLILIFLILTGILLMLR